MRRDAFSTVHENRVVLRAALSLSRSESRLDVVLRTASKGGKADKLLQCMLYYELLSLDIRENEWINTLGGLHFF